MEANRKMDDWKKWFPQETSNFRPSKRKKSLLQKERGQKRWPTQRRANVKRGYAKLLGSGKGTGKHEERRGTDNCRI